MPPSAHTDISPLSQLMMRVDAVADGTASVDSMPTGFPSLDKLLGGGLRRGDLVVLGGDVGVGKSALALAIALRARGAGTAVELISGEMDLPRVLERVLAIEGKASIDQIRQGNLDETTRAALGAAAFRLRETMPGISRLPAGGAAEVVAQAAVHEPALLVVDSLQAMAGTATGALDDELALAVRALKSHALDAQVAVLLTAHLPALDRSRPDLRPALDDFGARGAVKQLSDIVLGLFREELYAPSPGHEGATELAVLKNRSGPTSYVDLFFYKQWLRFEDMVE
ncbi:MAG TPA: DnaB-like helicase C-terminal domain-containing protein [Gemmatimonadaceae bacterium]